MTPEQIVDEVLALLSEDRIAAEIDIPIDRAVEEFVPRIQESLDFRAFNKVLGEFVLFLHRKAGIALPLPSVLAIAYAIQILGQYYEGTFFNGYEGACQDACRSEHGGAMLVLRRLAESVKAIERAKHARWVALTRLESRDWPTRLSIARYLLGEWKLLLSPEIQRCPAARFAYDLFSLIQLYQSSRQKTGHELAGAAQTPFR